MPRIIAVDLSVPRTNEEHGVGSRLVCVLEAPDVFTIRVEDISADELPGRERLHLEAEAGTLIQKLYISNAAGAGTAQLLVVD